MLGRRGHRVLVFERYPQLYDLPRAAVFDHEVMRIWQSLGIQEEIGGDLQPVRDYVWYGADGEQIMRIELNPEEVPSGWEPAYLFFQPRLEGALDRAARALPTVELHRPWTASSMKAHDDHVELVVSQDEKARTVRARYVIGADGANSFVRQAAGIAWEDLGFAERWLTLDLRPHDIAALERLPTSCQWCDPARPHMHTRNGREHRRWEFMLHPDERNEEFEDEARIWQLLAPWIRPDEGTILRHAVYEFRSLIAETMRSGRVLLAGDAAHLMPPFMGQGMCTGIRDAFNLAWKLDLVLRGISPDLLLDTYTPERRPQSESIVRLSMEMGRVSCERDPAAAAERDTALRAADAPPTILLPGLSEGVVARNGAGDATRLAGELSVQGTVRHGGREGRFDDVIGNGWIVLSSAGNPRAGLSGEQLSFLDGLGTRFASLAELTDLDGRLTTWLSDHGAGTVIVRPDFYVFGEVTAGGELGALVDELRDRL